MNRCLLSLPVALATPQLGLTGAERLDLSAWKRDIADRWDSLTDPVKIVLIGKYTGARDKVAAGQTQACPACSAYSGNKVVAADPALAVKTPATLPHGCFDAAGLPNVQPSSRRS